MKCSGCGKSVPFNGSVCPYCQRDKAADKRAIVWAWVFASVGAAIGGASGGPIGIFFGAILAAAVALALFKPKRTKAPEVKPVGEIETLAAPTDASANITARRLRELDALKKAGLVSEAEYEAKRRAILEAL